MKDRTATAGFKSLTLLVVTAAVAAVAYLLGWLKTVYYFNAFGIGPGLLDLSARDYLLESWFVVQNVLFFVLLWWIVLRTRVVWAGVVGVVHALIPIASHYAFAVGEWPPAGWLIQYRHTLLKLLPFLVLIVIWWLYPGRRSELRDLRWNRKPAAGALFALITLAWAVSSAKHFGSFDANRVMARTEESLARVRLHPLPETRPPRLPDGNAELYLLHANDDALVVWDRSGFRYGASAEVRVLVVPRSHVEWLEGTVAFRLQPGRQFL